MTAEPVGAPVLVLMVRGDDMGGVDEVRDDTDLRRLHLCSGRGESLGDLGPHVVGEILRQHRDRIGCAITHPFQPSGSGDGTVAGEKPQFDRDIGEHILDVEHQRDAADTTHDGSGRPQGQRWRHGQHTIGSETCRHADGSGERREAAEGDRPGREVALVGRKWIDATDPPPSGRLGADQAALPSRFDGMALVPRERGDDMESMPPIDELMGDARHDRAGRRDIRFEMGTEHDEVHGEEWVRRGDGMLRYSPDRARAESPQWK